MVHKELDINALGLNDETFAAPVNLDELPEQFAGFELPQPGTYIFTLPTQVSGVWPNGLWQKIDTGKEQRLKAQFRLGKTEDGQKTEFDGRLGIGEGRKIALSLTNAPLGKMPSKLDYLLGEGLGYTGILNSNAAYIKALAAEGGAKFKARLVWTASNKEANLRYSSRPWKSKDGSKEALPIPRDKNGFLQEFVDSTGKLLRCFPDLEGFSRFE